MLLKPISPAATTSGWLMYVPAVQLMQAEAPVDAMYVPAGHNEQVVADADVAPVCPYVPGEQRLPEQVDEEVAAEYVPAAQSMQVDCPASAYLPAAQACAAVKRTCAATMRTARLAAARVINVVEPLLRPADAQFTRPSAADDTSAVTSAIAVTQVVPFA